MVKEFFHLITSLFDKTLSWTTKTVTFFLILLFAWFANNTFDFIHNFRTSYKLEQLEKIKTILTDTTLTNIQRQQLLTDRDYIIRNRSQLDYLSSFFESLPSHISFTKRTTEANKPTKTAQPKNSETSFPVIIDSNCILLKNYWLHFLFSNFFLILALLVAPFVAFKNNEKLYVKIFATLIMGIIVYFICVFVAWVLDFIPIILNRPWINYILDFIIQIILWATLLAVTGLIQKKKNNR